MLPPGSKPLYTFFARVCEERLKECGLTTLATRILRGDQIEVFNKTDSNRTIGMFECEVILANNFRIRLFCLNLYEYTVH